MASEKNNTHLYSAKTEAEMKYRRREIYKLATIEKREDLLIHQRTKMEQSHNKNPSEVAGFHDSTRHGIDFAQQSHVTHLESLPTTFHMTKNITSQFHAFEVGSPSHLPNDSCGTSSETTTEKERKSRFITWLSKLFNANKGGQQPQFQGEDNVLNLPPPKPMTPGLNVITEYIIGLIIPGKLIANVYFKTFGYISMSQAVSFLADFKLGHYMKIPPRSMFIVQLVGTLIAGTTNMSVAWSAYKH